MRGATLFSVALAVLVGLATANTNVQMLVCQTAFNNTMAASNNNAGTQCTAFNTLNQCLINVIANCK